MVTPLFRYACGAREALMQQVERSLSALTPEKLALLQIQARRMALLAGRPAVRRQKTQD